MSSIRRCMARWASRLTMAWLLYWSVQRRERDGDTTGGRGVSGERPAGGGRSRQVVAITGAGGALGAALAAHYAGRPEVDLVLADVDRSSLDATLARLPDEGAATESLL